jgi:precorrin-6B methylase 2
MLIAASAACAQTRRPLEVPYVPTKTPIVDLMLEGVAVKPGDVIYDLGCGDGRIVIAAVRERGAQGVCVDIDAQRIAESRQNARQAGVADRIRFVHGDVLTTPIDDATVVMLFLSPELNLKLRPRLLGELRPGTRVVSHWHDMRDWAPRQTLRVRSNGRERPIHLWIVPRP